MSNETETEAWKTIEYWKLRAAQAERERDWEKAQRIVLADQIDRLFVIARATSKDEPKIQSPRAQDDHQD